MIVYVFCLFDATKYIDVIWFFIIEWTHYKKKRSSFTFNLHRVASYWLIVLLQKLNMISVDESWGLSQSILHYIFSRMIILDVIMYICVPYLLLIMCFRISSCLVIVCFYVRLLFDRLYDLVLVFLFFFSLVSCYM